MHFLTCLILVFNNLLKFHGKMLICRSMDNSEEFVELHY